MRSKFRNVDHRRAEFESRQIQIRGRVIGRGFREWRGIFEGRGRGRGVGSAGRGDAGGQKKSAGQRR